MNNIINKCIVAGCSLIMMTGITIASSTANVKSYLFVLRSKDSSITKKNGNYKLFMAAPHVVYFTDRPFRDENKMSSQQFVNLWNAESENSFSKNPPNAYVTGFSQSKNHKITKYVDNVVTLTNAVMNQNVIVFNVKPLGAKPLEPISSSEISVVVDGCGFGSQGSC